MNALTEAIKNAYQRQRELIQKQDDTAKLVTEALSGKIDNLLLLDLRNLVYRHYRRELEDINTALIALEGVRDATD